MRKVLYDYERNHSLAAVNKTNLIYMEAIMGKIALLDLDVLEDSSFGRVCNKICLSHFLSQILKMKLRLLHF